MCSLPGYYGPETVVKQGRRASKVTIFISLDGLHRHSQGTDPSRTHQTKPRGSRERNENHQSLYPQVGGRGLSVCPKSS